MSDKPLQGHKGPSRITYEVERYGVSELVELPFVIGVLGDFSGDSKKRKDIKDRHFEDISADNLDDMIAKWRLETGTASTDKDTTHGTEKSLHGLSQLVRMAALDPGICIRVMDISKTELETHLQQASDTDRANLFKTIYEQEFGTLEGQPFGLMVAEYEFTRQTGDITLLENLATMGAIACCPFVAAAAPGMFCVESWEELSHCEDIPSIFTSSAYLEWRRLRKNSDTRFLALTIPTVASEENEPLVNGAYAFAMAAIDTYSRTRGWNLDTPSVVFGRTTSLFSESQINQLADCGFLLPWQRKRTNGIGMHLCNIHRVSPTLDPGSSAWAPHQLHLSTILTIAQFLRTLRCIQRDKIGSFSDAESVESFLNNWLQDYIQDHAAVKNETESPRRPLCQARVECLNSYNSLGFKNGVFHVSPDLPGYRNSNCIQFEMPLLVIPALDF